MVRRQSVALPRRRVLLNVLWLRLGLGFLEHAGQVEYGAAAALAAAGGGQGCGELLAPHAGRAAEGGHSRVHSAQERPGRGRVRLAALAALAAALASAAAASVSSVGASPSRKRCLAVTGRELSEARLTRVSSRPVWGLLAWSSSPVRHTLLSVGWSDCGVLKSRGEALPRSRACRKLELVS